MSDILERLRSAEMAMQTAGLSAWQGVFTDAAVEIRQLQQALKDCGDVLADERHRMPRPDTLKEG